MVKEVKKSEEFKNILNNEITNSNGSSFYSGTLGIEFKSPELFYSIQHANIELTGLKNNDSWNVHVYLYDSYDFDEYRNNGTFADFANNVGYFLQNKGYITTYDWSISFEVNNYRISQ